MFDGDYLMHTSGLLIIGFILLGVAMLIATVFYKIRKKAPNKNKEL